MVTSYRFSKFFTYDRNTHRTIIYISSHSSFLWYSSQGKKGWEGGVDEVLHNACNVRGYKWALVGIYPMRGTASESWFVTMNVRESNWMLVSGQINITLLFRVYGDKFYNWGIHLVCECQKMSWCEEHPEMSFRVIKWNIQVTIVTVIILAKINVILFFSLDIIIETEHPERAEK